MLNVLQNTASSSHIYDIIQAEITTLEFAAMPDTTIGLYYPFLATIQLSSALQGTWSKEALAGILAHEGTHAEYDYNTQKWVDITTAKYGIDSDDLSWSTDPVLHPLTGQPFLQTSIEEEYSCFVAAANLWAEVKGSQTNAEMDTILALHQQGGTVLYDAVADLYQGLPLY